MPIHLDLSGPTEIRFAVSPLVELGSAWHVLIGADHHRAEWVPQLPAELLRRLEEWSFAARAVRATLLADPSLVPATEWEDQLSQVATMPVDTFSTAILRPLLRTRGRSVNLQTTEVLNLARARGTVVVRKVQQIVTEPEAARADFVDLLAQCWSTFFAGEWQRVYPLLRAEARRRAQLYAQYGLPEALAGLPRSIAAGAGRIVVDKVQNKRIPVAGRGLIVVATALCDGHVYVADEPGRPVTLQYPIASNQDADVRTTLRQLTVLANPARMEICRAIAVEPRSAREIARLWGLAEPAVTKHLSSLRAAGLVHTERVGHFVRYTLDDAAVGAIGANLLEVLRR